MGEENGHVSSCVPCRQPWKTRCAVGTDTAAHSTQSVLVISYRQAQRFFPLVRTRTHRPTFLFSVSHTFSRPAMHCTSLADGLACAVFFCGSTNFDPMSRTTT